MTFGVDTRVFRGLWTALLVGIVLYCSYKAASTLALFAFALFIAYLLRPAISFLDDLTPRRLPRSVSILFAYLVIFGLLVVLGGIVVASVDTEATAFVEQLPSVLKNDPVKSLPIPEALKSFRPQIQDLLRRELAGLQKNLVPIVQTALGQVISQLGNILSVILVPILTFFFLVDNGRMFKAIADLAPTSQSREAATAVLNDIQILLTNYMAALMGLGVCSFLASWAFLQASGVPYASLLAGLGGCLEMIPFLGPLIAAGLILVIAATAGYEHLSWILLFLIFFRLFQDYVVSPYLMGHGLELPPLATIFGVLAGEQIAGVIGMFFAIPILAAVRIVFSAYRRSGRRRDQGKLATGEEGITLNS